jgi:hypothetical protein
LFAVALHITQDLPDPKLSMRWAKCSFQGTQTLVDQNSTVPIITVNENCNSRLPEDDVWSARKATILGYVTQSLLFNCLPQGYFPGGIATSHDFH